MQLLGLNKLNDHQAFEIDSSTFEEPLKSVFKTTSTPVSLEASLINFIDTRAKSHKNKSIKGATFITEEQLIQSSIDEIDVGRGMLV